MIKYIIVCYKNNKNKIYPSVLIISLVFLFISIFLITHKNLYVQATAENKITICHASGLAGTTKFETLNLPEEAVYGKNDNSGHFNENGTTKAGHEQDHLGACTCTEEKTTCPTNTPVPTQIPSVSPPNSPTPTPTPTEIIILSPTPTPTETIIFSPSPTPTLSVPSPTPTPETLTPTATPAPTSTAIPVPTSTPTTVSSNNNQNSGGSSSNGGSSSANNSSSGSSANPVITGLARAISSNVLGVSNTYNPLVVGLEQAAPGEVLGESVLPGTDETVHNNEKLPTGNQLAAGLYLTIPKINVNEPVFIGQKLGPQLLVGQKEVLSTPAGQGTLFYGHNALDVFGSLYQLEPNDKVIVTDNQKVSIYRVTTLDYVSQTDLGILNTTTSRQIKLMTCSYTIPDTRIVVTAQKE